ncbi:glycosyltransferase family 4 protein [Aquicoccus porphyridii]|uniref:Glycosyltransferase family 4 protein n=1 Tax=Aquicoccus porphyridii TaxID=1852029 RepID=A0A5A9YYL5_9RHOB|nr:glycosyltransferase family 4 protein [Aquicoccus porphyridii]KAA0909962.1 glycosyltransferase family 4 protein [Aquicoccus porphyridii]RAI52059.1 glycosyl transferase family 1 [Rhodobacteraceae bacterium AsT-22]
MKAIFAHDHRFIPIDGAVWSESQFEAALWSRYLSHFDSLTVIGRRGELPPGKTVGQLEKSSAPGVEFNLFPNLSSLQGLTLARPAAMRQMQELVAAHDAVIARLPSEVGFLAIAAARATGKPWAVEAVGCPWDGMWHYGSLTGRAYAPLAWLRMRRALRLTDHAIYVTRDFLQRRYPTQAQNTGAASNVVLHTVSNTTLVARTAKITAMPMRPQTQPLRLGLIGTLHNRYKGIQTLMAAIGKSRNHLPPLSLHILGGGDPVPWQAEAERLGVGDLVHFEGTLPAGAPVLEWLDEIDVYLQPSFQEGLPRALIEAMSRGCPALASTAAGIPELLPAEDLIKPGDTAALAALLRRCVTDRDWMADRARRNWAEAHEYQAEVLDARRVRFWQTFRQSIEPPAI